jgi:hypothetical protein
MAPPISVSVEGASLRKRRARMVAPTGSPRRLMETMGAETYLRAQL